MINYILIPNKLKTSKKSRYLPRTVVKETIDLDQLVTELSRGTTVMPADVRAVLENLSEITMNNLKRGRSVNLGFVALRTIVKGAFNSSTESFSKDKHHLEITATVSQSFQEKTIFNAKTQRIETKKAAPIISSIFNLSTQNSSTIKAGDLISIKGKWLIFDNSNTELGVFLINESESIAIIEYGEIKDASILFKVPETIKPNSTYNEPFCQYIFLKI